MQYSCIGRNQPYIMKTLATPSTIKQAHQLRNEAAKDLGVPTKFISFASCIKKAAGEGTVTDQWGYATWTKSARVNAYLISDDCSIVLDMEDLHENTGYIKPFISNHLKKLHEAGVLLDSSGWLSIKADRRP